MCDKHPPFDLRGQGDRAFRLDQHAQAVKTADALARLDGLRRRVVLHHGQFTRKGAWFVQKLDRPRKATAREAVAAHNAALTVAAPWRSAGQAMIAR